MAGPLQQVHVSPSGVQRCAGRVVSLDDDFTIVATTLGANVYQQGNLRSVLCGHNRAVIGLSYVFPYLVTVAGDDQLLAFHVPREAQVLARALPSTPTAVALRPSDASRGVLATAQEISTFSLGGDSSQVLLRQGGCCSVQWHPSESIVACGFSTERSSCVRIFDTSSAGESIVFNPSKALGSSQADSFGDVTQIEWDPLGQTYFLALYSAFGILLWDSSNQSVLRAFPNASSRNRIASLAWLPSAPGLFLSAGIHSGVVTVWNVSQDSSVGTERIPTVDGIHDLVAKRTSSSVAPVEQNSQTSSAAWTAREDLLIATRHGGVVAFSCAQRTVTWQAPQGHTDTVFDAAFCPSDANLLATCSFDSTVRLWSAEDFKCLNVFKVSQRGNGAKVCLYALAWEPGYSGRLAVSDNNGGVFMIHTKTGAMRSLPALHAAPILRIAWCASRPGWVATTSTNGVAQVWEADTGNIVQKLTHLQPSHGVAWQEPPYTGAKVAAAVPALLLGNSTGNVLRWEVASGRAPVAVRLHSSVVFNVAPSPLSPHLVATSSNDGNVGVWNTNEGTTMLLRGHTDRVRALTWHHELVNVLISGSWDSTIRVWDVRSGQCLGVCREHRSDVYAVVAHPARPDTFVSVSRDTTLRWWKMQQPSAGLRAALLAAAGVHLAQGGAHDQLHSPHFLDSATSQVASMLQSKASPGFSSANQALSVSYTVQQIVRFAILQGGSSISLGDSSLLAGTASRNLATLLRPRLDDKPFDPFHVLQGLFSSFLVSAGTQALLRSIQSAASNDEHEGVQLHASALAKSVLYPTGVQPVIPQALIASVVRAAAAELDVRTCRTHVHIGGPKRETALRAAAAMYLRIGETEHYCDICAELGDWEAALAAAPAVSLHYWQTLLQRRARSLEGAPLSTVEPLLLLTGRRSEAIQRHDAQGSMLLAASLVSSHGVAQPAEQREIAASGAAAAVENKGLKPILAAPAESSASESKEASSGDAPRVPSLEKLFDGQAAAASQAGKPTLAAAWRLATGLSGCPQAIESALAANETELAWILSASVPAQFSRAESQPAAMHSLVPLLHNGQVKWVQTTFQPGQVLPVSPADEAARRMCLRCFRHGLWGAGLAVLRAAGWPAHEVSLYAARIPLTAGLVATAAQHLAEQGSASGSWVDACDSAAAMSRGVPCDTSAALRQVLPQDESAQTGAAFSPYCPSLSQLLYGKSGRELEAHASLDAAAKTRSLALDGLAGLSALYTACGLQPRHQIADRKSYTTAFESGNIVSCVKMLLRCGEFALATETACVHLQREWSAGSAQWSGAVLARIGDLQTQLQSGSMDSTAQREGCDNFWNVQLHPNWQSIAALTNLLQHAPLAVLPENPKHQGLLYSALFGVFDSMSRGFAGVVSPLCRFLAAQEGRGGLAIPLPFKVLRLVQGAYELVVAGDAQNSLIALQRYCIPLPEQDTLSLQEASPSPASAPDDGADLHAAFAAANRSACQLAEGLASIAKQVVARTSGHTGRDTATAGGGTLGTRPMSSVLPGTSTTVDADVAFQHHPAPSAPAAAASGSGATPLPHFASAVTAKPVQRGAISLENRFVAAEQEALEWALVCAFSPTGSGEWLVPF